MQSLTTVADPVWNSFISERVTVNSRERNIQRYSFRMLDYTLGYGDVIRSPALAVAILYESASQWCNVISSLYCSGLVEWDPGVSVDKSPPPYSSPRTVLLGHLPLLQLWRWLGFVTVCHVVVKISCLVMPVQRLNLFRRLLKLAYSLIVCLIYLRFRVVIVCFVRRFSRFLVMLSCHFDDVVYKMCRWFCILVVDKGARTDVGERQLSSDVQPFWRQHSWKQRHHPWPLFRVAGVACGYSWQRQRKVGLHCCFWSLQLKLISLLFHFITKFVK